MSYMFLRVQWVRNLILTLNKRIMNKIKEILLLVPLIFVGLFVIVISVIAPVALCIIAMWASVYYLGWAIGVPIDIVLTVLFIAILIVFILDPEVKENL